MKMFHSVHEISFLNNMELKTKRKKGKNLLGETIDACDEFPDHTLVLSPELEGVL